MIYQLEPASRWSVNTQTIYNPWSIDHSIAGWTSKTTPEIIHLVKISVNILGLVLPLPWLIRAI